MREKPLISVIIPVYNVESYLEECVQSVRNQTWANLEIILIDDGSTDASGTLCDSFSKEDTRIRVIHKENEGQAEARNRGLRAATGDYIGFVDSDDKIAPVMFETLLQLCRKNDVALACARFDTFGEDGGWKDPYENGKTELLSAHDLLEMIIWPWTAPERYSSIAIWNRLYRNDILKNVFFPEGKKYEDILFSTEAILAAGTCAYINRSLYHYRIRKESTTGTDAEYNERWLTDKLPFELEQIHLLQKYGHKDLATMQKYCSCMDLYRMKQQCTDKRKRREIKAAISSVGLSVAEIWQNIPDLEGKIKTSLKYLLFEPYTVWKMKKKREEDERAKS